MIPEPPITVLSRYEPTETDLYKRFLLPEEIDILLSVRRESLGAFKIGEIAEAVRERNQGKGVPLFVLYSLVAELGGYGWRRVEKFRTLHLAFPREVRERFPDMPLSYFEEAFNLPVEDRIPALEFAEEWYEQKSRYPGADNLARLYSTQMVGKHLGDPVVEAQALLGPRAVVQCPPDPPTPPEPAGTHSSWVSAITISRLLDMWRSRRDALTVEDCLADLEALL